MSPSSASATRVGGLGLSCSLISPPLRETETTWPGLLFHFLPSRDLDHKESVRLSKRMRENCLNLVRQVAVLELAGDLSRLESCRRVLPRFSFERDHATIKV